jgi:hypothetical protein
MGVYHDFDDVDAFTVGAVGRPGQRTFLIQARRGRERVRSHRIRKLVLALALALALLGGLPKGSTAAAVAQVPELSEDLGGRWQEALSGLCVFTCV